MKQFGRDFWSFLVSRSILWSISKYSFKPVTEKVGHYIVVFLFFLLFSQASSFGWFWSGLLASIGWQSVNEHYCIFHINYWRFLFRYNLLRKKFPPTSFTGSPVLSDAGFDLLNKLLTYDPDKVYLAFVLQALKSHSFASASYLWDNFFFWLQRITADAALEHEWFHEVPRPKSKDFMPTFPAQHAQDRYTCAT